MEKSSVRKLFFIALAFIVVVGIGYSTGRLKAPIKIASLPIKFVRTEGVFQYITKEEIKAALLPSVTGNFLEADMQAIHNAVAAMPWVEAVTVKRIWPDTIDIRVTEKKAYVRWGEDSLMTEQGVIFKPKTIEAHQELIKLTGPDGQQMKVLEIMKGIVTALDDHSMTLAEFAVNKRWAWTLKLTSGLEILLGRDEQLKKLQRFLKSLTVLTPEQIDAMAVVDLRYPNGYAVSWKPDRQPDWQNGLSPEQTPPQD
ncbi:cell division protein FtsQ/DivIB [Methylocucumis oryzae]|uniref:Cell division protein FtsQ n=1 Tax=Methylocucumis oryzae TaxID=1632867 RepID=A0A0F3IFT2_9GAMM|nr:cell division protein FtsQ/DivIB [Methylocucumis oryzae]KJV05655.1 cell division protein FtsQ [Methylocucumis oryzae]